MEMGEGRREVCWADWEMGMVLRGGGGWEWCWGFEGCDEVGMQNMLCVVILATCFQTLLSERRYIATYYRNQHAYLCHSTRITSFPQALSVLDDPGTIIAEDDSCAERGGRYMISTKPR